MAKPTKETIPDLLVRNVPREIIMGIEEALVVGAQRAYVAARGMGNFHHNSDLSGRLCQPAARDPYAGPANEPMERAPCVED